MRVHFETESGSTYEIRSESPVERYIRRTNRTAAKRADGGWVRLFSIVPLGGPYVGRRAHLTLESLAGFGPDDYGNTDASTGYTTRSTSVVTKIWKEGT